MSNTKQTTIGLFTALSTGLIVLVLLNMLLPFQQAALLGLVTFMVILWSNETLPLGWVALFPIVAFPMFGIADTNSVAPNYAKSIIFLFLGGFMLAIAVEKTGLHKVISNKMLAIFPSTARGMIFALAITSGTLSAFLSNTTTTLLLIPLALFLSEDLKLKVRFALAIAYGASIGGIITPIGTPPNLILFGILEEHHIASIPFVQWITLVLPLALMMFLVVGWILSLGTDNTLIPAKEGTKKLSSNQKKVSVALIALISLLLINSPIEPYYSGLGLNEKGILLGFGLMMFLPPFNILNWDDSHKIPYEIIFLFGAGFAIANAFTDTGLADQLAAWLQTATNLPPLMLLVLIAAIVTFSTEITSNTALISMVLPVIYAVTEQNGLDSRLFMMVATICASYAFMLPIATPPNAIAMSSGAVTVKIMARYGIIFNVIGILLITLTATVYWQAFL